MTKKAIERLVDKYEPKIRARFLRAFWGLRAKYTPAKIEAALEAATASQILDDVDRAGGALATSADAAFAASAHVVAAELSKRPDEVVLKRVEVVYDGTNARAVAAMRANRLRLVSGLTEQAREAMTDVLAQMTGAGLNPRQMAVAIRDGLGLTPEQARWVQNYRARLEALDRGALRGELRDARYDETVDAAITARTPLTAKQVDKMVDRYAARALKYRSEVVARTEALRAVHEGADEMYQQGIDAGTIDQRCIVCSWHAGDGPPTRDWHQTMKGQKRPWGVAFVSGKGNALMRPCDADAPASECANCRCKKSVRIYATPEAAQSALAAAGYTGVAVVVPVVTPAPAAAPPPVAAPPPPPPVDPAAAYSAKVEKQFLRTVSRSKTGDVSLDGIPFARIEDYGGRFLAVTGLHDRGRAQHVPDELGIFDTRAEADAAIAKAVADHVKRSAGRVQGFKRDAMVTAAAVRDFLVIRRMVRGLLHEDEVLPRDALYERSDSVLEVKPDDEMGGSAALHDWKDGQTLVRADVIEGLAQPSKAKDYQGMTMMDRSLGTLIHEELHGATPYTSPDFYRSFGSSIEEVTVETAARKLLNKATGATFNTESGSYQKTIDQFADIIGQVTGNRRGAVNKLADAGIKMRAPGAPTFDSPEGILDAFIEAIDIEAKYKPKLRQAIIDQVEGLWD